MYNKIYYLTTFSHKEASEVVPYAGIKSSMKKWRREIFPTNIQTVKDLAEAFKDIKILKLHQDANIKLQAKLVTDSNGDNHIIFFIPILLKKIFKK